MAPASPDIYPLSLHDALPIWPVVSLAVGVAVLAVGTLGFRLAGTLLRSRVEPTPAVLALVNRGVAVLFAALVARRNPSRSEEHTSELQSHVNLVCRLLLEKKK